MSTHTDNSDMEYPAGALALQVMKKAEQGGESILADCMKAAEIIRKEDPEAFQ